MSLLVFYIFYVAHQQRMGICLVQPPQSKNDPRLPPWIPIGALAAVHRRRPACGHGGSTVRAEAQVGSSPAMQLLLACMPSCYGKSCAA